MWKKIAAGAAEGETWKALAAGAAEGWRGLLPKTASATTKLVPDSSPKSATPTAALNLVADAVAAWRRWLRSPSASPTASVGGVASLATRVDAALALLVHGSSFVGDSRAPTNSTAVSTTCSPASSIVCCTEGEGVSHCCFVGISVTQLLDVVDELAVPSGAPRQVNSSELI
ncbi:hypothetical protein OsI_05809 [Oryza sativa Indica Group]|uniref:Uncharacterized protein n=1 Tax=Oryza sativa subsp. indica TaxID=39946 RepID=B8AHF5_ORYSI|nr:hypothetical protein OsI_05809 [Oryza sativa Indica Group]